MSAVVDRPAVHHVQMDYLACFGGRIRFTCACGKRLVQGRREPMSAWVARGVAWLAQHPSPRGVRAIPGGAILTAEQGA